MRRFKGVIYVVAGLLLATAFGLRVTGAAKADEPTLGSYSVIAAAPGFEFTEDEPSAQAHPEGQGDVPYTTSLLTGGGVGYGLSSIAWPGAYGGNAGSLILVALPSQIGPVPRPDPVTDAVKTASPALQYPIKAEARAGSSPDASYAQIPGTTLTSHADTNDAHAVADVQGAQQPGQATFKNMHSDSSSTINGSSVKALANSVIHDLDFGGGAIKIKTLTSTATATTDGKNSSANGGTVFQGLEVGGQPAYLDEGGLHIGTQNNPANAAAAQIANQALSKAGFTFYVSQPKVERDGGNVSYTAASVLIYWEPPNNPNKNVFIWTLGGARVSVAAGEGFGVPTETATEAASGSTDTGDTGAAALGATAELPSDTSPVDSGTGAIATGTSGGQAPSTGGGEAIDGRTIAKTFGGIGPGWLVAGLAAAFLLGVGSRRLIIDLIDKPAATCPLEVRR